MSIFSDRIRRLALGLVLAATMAAQTMAGTGTTHAAGRCWGCGTIPNPSIHLDPDREILTGFPFLGRGRPVRLYLYDLTQRIWVPLRTSSVIVDSHFGFTVQLDPIEVDVPGHSICNTYIKVFARDPVTGRAPSTIGWWACVF